MARGWESKSVESQRESAGAARERGRARSAEERQRAQKRHGLELSRTRVLHQMEETESPVRRASLAGALAHLEAELAKLEET